jgi:glycosyltransferase involved in cell wall biosynthesis
MASSSTPAETIGRPVIDPVASLVVPSYGGERRLPVLFDALRAQRCAVAWEVVVVLDGVVDASESVIDAASDLGVRVVRFAENRGRPAALNAGFDAARGKVLIRCDDDLEPAPSYVADHVLAHRGGKPVGVVGLYHNRFGDTAYARAYGHRYDTSVRAGAYRGSLGDPRYFWAGNCSVTRATFDRVGPYDERFRTYGWEDIDWGFRLAAAGVPIVLDPRLETTHHAANVDAVIRLRRAYASGLARVRFDDKHGTTYAPEAGVGTKARLWRALVHRTAARATPDRLATWGRRIDELLPRVPPPVGFRVLAGAVDAAALAGYRQGRADAAGAAGSPERSTPVGVPR